MGVGGALSFNGIDATLAAGAPAIPPLPAIPAVPFPAITLGESCVTGTPLDDVGFTYGLPPVDTNFNVLVNGYAMTVKADTFGESFSFGDLSLSEPLCNPDGPFEVPEEASIPNVLVNGVPAAIPGVTPLDVAPIVSLIDADLMAMQTSQTNVKLYW